MKDGGGEEKTKTNKQVKRQQSATFSLEMLKLGLGEELNFFFFFFSNHNILHISETGFWLTSACPACSLDRTLPPRDYREVGGAIEMRAV